MYEMLLFTLDIENNWLQICFLLELLHWQMSQSTYASQYKVQSLKMGSAKQIALSVLKKLPTNVL